MGCQTKDDAECKRRVRTDFKCGVGNNAADGKPAACNPKWPLHEGSSNAPMLAPCCSVSGWCGNSESHCGGVDYRKVGLDGKGPPKPPGPPRPDGTMDISGTVLKKTAVIISYRDRAVHLKKFLEHFSKRPRSPGHFFVIEQDDKAPFNRAWLFNVGLTEIFKNYPDIECVVTHDVDFLPEPTVDYKHCSGPPTLLAAEIECWSWSIPYGGYTGGVVKMQKADWKKINGYSNDYVGWGGEDDDLHHRLRLNKLTSASGYIAHPPAGKGRYTCMHDDDHTPRVRGTYGKTLGLLGEMAAGSDRWKTEGLNSVKYTVTSKQDSPTGNVHLFKVKASA